MKIRIIYRPKSDHGRRIEQFAHDFTSRLNLKVDLVDIDTRGGVAEATLYGIMAYPAILVMKEDGTLMMSWQGEELPLMDELASYARV